MTYSVGYFCDNNHPTIAEIEASWGSYLEELTDAEKVYFVQKLTASLIPVVDGEIDTEMIDRAAADINEIPVSDRIGLAEAFLANTYDK